MADADDRQPLQEGDYLLLHAAWEWSPAAAGCRISLPAVAAPGSERAAASEAFTDSALIRLPEQVQRMSAAAMSLPSCTFVAPVERKVGEEERQLEG